MTAESGTMEPKSTPEESAAYWLMRMSSGECGPSDRAAFEQWRQQNPVHAQAYARAEQGLSMLDRHLNQPDITALSEEALAQTVPAAFAGRRWMMSLAASILVVGVAGLLVWQNWQPSLDQPGEIAANEFRTGVGERSTVTLVDGSTVVLNTATRITVDYVANQRQIKLHSGQALFEVAKDSARPFVVAAGDRLIKALGTEFDVRLHDDSALQVTLLEGRVAVDKVATKGAASADTEVLEREELVPGEQLLASVNRPTTVVSADIEQVTSWRNGRLVFRAEPLRLAVEEVNRYSVSQLALADDPRLEQVTVSGVFDTGRTASFLLALETAYPLKVEELTPERSTLMWRD